MQFSVSDRHDVIVEQIQETISEHELIPKGAHVVLGLSGGPDSVCMFHVLAMLADQMDLKLHAVHVNHQLRGEAADQDRFLRSHYSRCQNRGHYHGPGRMH